MRKHIARLTPFNRPPLIREKECRKFEKEMEICKIAADACVTCFNECKKIAV